MYPKKSLKFDDFHEIDCQLQHSLHYTGSAFFQSFGRFTEIQRSSIPLIHEGNDVLVFSSTASGKTEAACAPLIDRFIQEKEPWTILYISPTKALVNDLYSRLYSPAQRLNLRLKRRTGDHRDSLTQIPHILITTPESFDSLLCRNKRSDRYGHDLALVKAVILDEIHLLYGTARGEQLKWLLRRLRKLKSFAAKNEWCSSDKLQIIGLSATLPNPESVLLDFFPDTARIASSDKKRPIEIVKADSESISVSNQILVYLSSLQQNEKILIFSKSRKRVDYLTFLLKSQSDKIGYEIYAHHGSLSKKLREEAEWAIKNKDRIILIATSTLEIGIDIGNIDLVILDGPPPDISSLLQRIGRGNRRTHKTRVMICAEKLPDYILQHAMIDAARDGWLGEGKKGPNYAVIRQQIASYIYQSPRKERSKKSLSDLFCSSTQLASTFQSILNKMIENEELIEEIGDVLQLGEYWLQKAEKMGQIHTNISSNSGYSVVDIDSGDVLADGVLFYGGRGLGVAGKNLEVKSWDSLKLEVRDLIHKGEPDGDWKYSSRPFFVDSSQPQALKRYLKFEKNVWPIVQKDGFSYVFHCGGAIRNAMLTLLMNQYGSRTNRMTCNEWYLKLPLLEDEKPSWMNTFHAEGLALSLYSDESLLKKLEFRLRRPLSSVSLPYDVRVNEVLEWLNIESEERDIKDSIWINNLDDISQDTLMLYIQS